MEPRVDGEHLTVIHALLEDVAVRTVEPMGEGWDCFTHEVNGAWIVQIPRHDHAERHLRTQMALLPELAREVSAPIPVPERTSEAPAAMAYRKLPGRALTTANLPPDARLAERLGRFLYDLHVTPLEVLGMRGGGPKAWRDRMRDQLDAFRDLVFPEIDEAERARAETMFGGYLDPDANFRFPDALVHADLVPEHILVDDAGDLTGVIDWGDAQPGDPAIDFAWLLGEAPELGGRALAAYGGAPDTTFRERASFYFALSPWYTAHYGRFMPDAGRLAEGLAALRERLPG